MPTLNEYKKMHMEQATRKGWGRDVATKIYYAMIELGEAGDAWKHRGDEDYLVNAGIDDMKLHMKMEFIDTILYCINGLYCLDEYVDIDRLMVDKMKVNEERERIYVDDTNDEQE